jgi:hypothetical protein
VFADGLLRFHDCWVNVQGPSAPPAASWAW